MHWQLGAPIRARRRCIRLHRQGPLGHPHCPPPPPSPTPTQGGTHSRDLPWINAHLNTIGRTLILSILAFTACLWAARALGAAAWAARFALVSVHLALLAWDHGGDFQHHGFYNW